MTDDEMDNLHKLHHAWLKEMDESDDYLDLMNRLDNFLKFNKDASVVGVDDSYFSSSDIVIIPHKTKNHFMGLSCWFIPQCSGEQPISFFLYPGHLNNFIQVLQKYQKEIKEMKNE